MNIIMLQYSFNSSYFLTFPDLIFISSTFVSLVIPYWPWTNVPLIMQIIILTITINRATEGFYNDLVIVLGTVWSFLSCIWPSVRGEALSIWHRDASEKWILTPGGDFHVKGLGILPVSLGWKSRILVSLKVFRTKHCYNKPRMYLLGLQAQNELETFSLVPRCSWLRRVWGLSWVVT